MSKVTRKQQHARGPSVTLENCTARCPLCKYPLTLRMTRKGPCCPCPCQNPEEPFCLGNDFVMPEGTPGSTAKRLNRMVVARSREEPDGATTPAEVTEWLGIDASNLTKKEKRP